MVDDASPTPASSRPITRSATPVAAPTGARLRDPVPPLPPAPRSRSNGKQGSRIWTYHDDVLLLECTKEIGKPGKGAATLFIRKLSAEHQNTVGFEDGLTDRNISKVVTHWNQMKKKYVDELAENPTPYPLHTLTWASPHFLTVTKGAVSNSQKNEIWAAYMDEFSTENVKNIAVQIEEVLEAALLDDSADKGKTPADIREAIEVGNAARSAKRDEAFETMRKNAEMDIVHREEQQASSASLRLLINDLGSNMRILTQILSKAFEVELPAPANDTPLTLPVAPSTTATAPSTALAYQVSRAMESLSEVDLILAEHDDAEPEEEPIVVGVSAPISNRSVGVSAPISNYRSEADVIPIARGQKVPEEEDGDMETQQM